MWSLSDYHNLITEISNEGSYSRIRLQYQSKLTYHFQGQEETAPSRIKKGRVDGKISNPLIIMARQLKLLFKFLGQNQYFLEQA